MCQYSGGARYCKVMFSRVIFRFVVISFMFFIVRDPARTFCLCSYDRAFREVQTSGLQTNLPFKTQGAGVPCLEMFVFSELFREINISGHCKSNCVMLC